MPDMPGSPEGGLQPTFKPGSREISVSNAVIRQGGQAGGGRTAPPPPLSEIPPEQHESHWVRNSALLGTIAATAIGAGALASRMFGGGGNPDSADSKTSAGQTIDVSSQPDTALPQGTAVVVGDKVLGSNPGPATTEVAKTTPTVEVKQEAPFPYELGFKNEIKGPDVTVVFGIEKSVMERSEDNKCADDSGKEFNCPPIKKIELSDKYLKQLAPDLYPNGMSQEEMIGLVESAILSSQLFNLKLMKPEYNNLTIEGLRELIHQGKAPKYIHPAIGEEIDTSKPVYVVAINNPNGSKASGNSAYDLKAHDGSMVLGIWEVTSFGLGEKEASNHPEAYKFANRAAAGFVYTVDPANVSKNYLPIRNSLLPYFGSQTAAGIINVE